MAAPKDMKLWVGVTDKDWLQYLSRINPDEVNFWQPSGSRVFRALQPGEPFLFKLHSPDNYIVGGGHFVRYSALPASVAWEAFGQKNGVSSLDELNERIRRYRRGSGSVDPMIGCNILAQPFFLPRSSWIPVPDGWAPNIVQGKTYDTGSDDGAALWESVRAAIKSASGVAEPCVDSEYQDQPRFGAEYLARGRLGQGAFRVLVMDAYERRCAVTGEKTLPVLEAAHIKPFAQSGPHKISNGIFLRSDLHKLFDLGYLTVTPELIVEVSPRLKSDWKNGREYYAHHGQALRIQPSDAGSQPAREYLSWHNDNIFHR